MILSLFFATLLTNASPAKLQEHPPFQTIPRSDLLTVVHHWIEKNRGALEFTGYLHNIYFHKQSKNQVEWLRQLVTFKYEGMGIQFESKHSLEFASECPDPICVARKLFGKSEGPVIMYLMGKYGLNASPFAYQSPEAFKDFLPSHFYGNQSYYGFWWTTELMPILQAIEDLPPIMHSSLRNLQLRRVSRGLADPDFTAFKDGCLMASVDGEYPPHLKFFDCMFNGKPDPNPIKAISSRPSYAFQVGMAYHELAHVMDLNFVKINSLASWRWYIGPNNISNWSMWTQISAWDQVEDPEENTIDGNLIYLKCMPSLYAARNPKEDFAESFAAYRYSSKYLKETCPAKYQFLKEMIFQGVEYL